mgnify:CR=1 FL=1
MGMPKVFISHAYKDRLLVDAFVNLLTKAGIPEEQIVCSSTAGTQLHTGNSLYAELRKELTNDNVFVIFMLSENFYASPVCLNEMGAAWIRDAKCHVILLPEFTFGQMKGVICEKGLIGIPLDSYDRPAVERFNHLRCDLATFGFILSFDKWDLAILDFYRAIDVYKKKFKDGIVIDMADVRSYCIDDADTLVFANGYHVENTMEEMLKEAGVTYHLVGDGNKVGSIKEAISGAYELAKAI